MTTTSQPIPTPHVQTVCTAPPADALPPVQPTLDTPRFLIGAALIVSHCGALGALEGARCGADEQGGWGDPSRFCAHLMDLYEPEDARRLLGLMPLAWQATAPGSGFPGVGWELGWEGLPTPAADLALTSFTRRGVVACAPGAGPSALCGDDLVMNEVFGQLIGLARDWQAALPDRNGLGEWPRDNVARSAEFAHLLLDAVARAVPGQPLDLPGVTGGPLPVGAARRRAARGLCAQPAFLALDTRQRQRLSELLTLMPTFLAAMYEHSRLAGDHDSQDMVAELANDYLGDFFAEPPHRTDFGSLNLLELGDLGG